MEKIRKSQVNITSLGQLSLREVENVREKEEEEEGKEKKKKEEKKKNKKNSSHLVNKPTQLIPIHILHL
jgi:hypothetical protein